MNATLAQFFKISGDKDVVKVPVVDVLTLKKFSDGLIYTVALTETPHTRLDLVHGDTSPWNDVIIPHVVRHVRKAALEVSSSGEVEGWVYFTDVVKNRLRSLYEAFSFSLPQQVEEGKAETREQAWDRFDQRYCEKVGVERSLYRLVAVSMCSSSTRRR